MTIKEIETLSGLPRANIRYYESEGLITPRRAENGYRDYSQADADALLRIKLLRALGLTIEQIKTLARGETALDAVLADRLQAMQQEATRQQRVSQIQAQWEAQAAQLKTQYPDFELQEVLANEQVADLMRRGVSLPDAYRAAYFDHIMQQATAQTAQKVEQGVAARIQQRAGRPGENGTRPGGAVTTHVDVASMSRRQLEDLERRARRGEKITL